MDSSVTSGLRDSPPDYPRPQLRRAQWTTLNGQWDFAIDHEANFGRPEHVVWECLD